MWCSSTCSAWGTRPFLVADVTVATCAYFCLHIIHSKRIKGLVKDITAMGVYCADMHMVNCNKLCNTYKAVRVLPLKILWMMM
jgi:hypothetical protein